MAGLSPGKQSTRRERRGGWCVEQLQSNCDIRWLGWLGSQHYTRNTTAVLKLNWKSSQSQCSKHATPNHVGRPAAGQEASFRESLSRVDLSHWAWPASGPAVTLRRVQLVASLSLSRLSLSPLSLSLTLGPFILEASQPARRRVPMPIIPKYLIYLPTYLGTLGTSFPVVHS